MVLSPEPPGRGGANGVRYGWGYGACTKPPPRPADALMLISWCSAPRLGRRGGLAVVAAVEAEDQRAAGGAAHEPDRRLDGLGAVEGQVDPGQAGRRHVDQPPGEPRHQRVRDARGCPRCRTRAAARRPPRRGPRGRRRTAPTPTSSPGRRTRCRRGPRPATRTCARSRTGRRRASARRRRPRAEPRARPRERPGQRRRSRAGRACVDAAGVSSSRCVGPVVHRKPDGSVAHRRRVPPSGCTRSRMLAGSAGGSAATSRMTSATVSQDHSNRSSGMLRAGCIR